MAIKSCRVSCEWLWSRWSIPPLHQHSFLLSTCTWMLNDKATPASSPFASAKTGEKCCVIFNKLNFYFRLMEITEQRLSTFFIVLWFLLLRALLSFKLSCNVGGNFMKSHFSWFVIANARSSFSPYSEFWDVKTSCYTAKEYSLYIHTT